MLKGGFSGIDLAWKKAGWGKPKWLQASWKHPTSPPKPSPFSPGMDEKGKKNRMMALGAFAYPRAPWAMDTYCTIHT